MKLQRCLGNMNAFRLASSKHNPWLCITVSGRFWTVYWIVLKSAPFPVPMVSAHDQWVAWLKCEQHGQLYQGLRFVECQIRKFRMLLLDFARPFECARIPESVYPHWPAAELQLTTAHRCRTWDDRIYHVQIIIIINNNNNIYILCNYVYNLM